MKTKITLFQIVTIATLTSSFAFAAATTTATATTDAKAQTASTKETAKQNKGFYDAPIKGTILEKIDATNYSYLKIKTQTEETWVAVPQLEIKLNTEVELQKPIPMFGFESKTLKRKFDKIYFGLLKSQKEEIEKQKKTMKK
jgi:hypothetical protein